jgi:hypothetical protein
MHKHRTQRFQRFDAETIKTRTVRQIRGATDLREVKYSDIEISLYAADEASHPQAVLHEHVTPRDQFLSGLGIREHTNGKKDWDSKSYYIYNPPFTDSTCPVT